MHPRTNGSPHVPALPLQAWSHSRCWTACESPGFPYDLKLGDAKFISHIGLIGFHSFHAFCWRTSASIFEDGKSLEFQHSSVFLPLIIEATLAQVKSKRLLISSAWPGWDSSWMFHQKLQPPFLQHLWRSLESFLCSRPLRISRFRQYPDLVLAKSPSSWPPGSVQREP